MATVIIASWPLACVLFNGAGGVRGPVPVLCCDGAEEARQSIMADSLGFAAELEKLASRYNICNLYNREKPPKKIFLNWTLKKNLKYKKLKFDFSN